MALSLTQRDRNVIWHPYTPQKYRPDPIPIVKGEGIFLIGEDGSRYIDAISSWWVTIHGHGHPYIAERIYAQAMQLEQVIFAGFTHEPAVSLAEQLLELLPGNFSRVFYSDNGSTATEVAIKMALQYWWNREETQRTRIIALTHSYHGDTFGAMSVSERGIFTLAYQERLFEVLFLETPVKGQPLVFQSYDASETPTLLAEAACLIYEPLLQGAGGMKMYPAEALDQLIVQCHRAGVICIADEVMTGFGRTGTWFSSSQVEEKPDIICLSKGLTGGTIARGVTACTSEIYDAFVNEDKLKSFFHGHSFTANPIACTAALASLELLLEPATSEQIQSIVELHRKFIEELKERHPDLTANHRQTGTIVAFEVTDTVSGYNSGIREVFTEKALKKGVYLRPLGNTVYIMPPYCISPLELQQVYSTIFDILEEIRS